MCRSDRCTKFPGKVFGRFLQNVAVPMNWCDVNSVDSLWLSLQMQRQGVETCYELGWQPYTGEGNETLHSATSKGVPRTAAANDITDTNKVPLSNDSADAR